MDKEKYKNYDIESTVRGNNSTKYSATAWILKYQGNFTDRLGPICLKPEYDSHKKAKREILKRAKEYIDKL